MAIIFPCEVNGTTFFAKGWPLFAHLSVGCVAYALGYLAAPAGRGDFRAIVSKLAGRTSSTANAAPNLTEAVVLDEFVIEQVDTNKT